MTQSLLQDLWEGFSTLESIFFLLSHGSIARGTATGAYLTSNSIFFFELGNSFSDNRVPIAWGVIFESLECKALTFANEDVSVGNVFCGIRFLFIATNVRLKTHKQIYLHIYVY